MKEVWADIKGFEGKYKVSTFGRVMSLDRKVPCTEGFRKMKGRVLSIRFDKDGYPRTNLSDKTVKIHRVVAETFILNLFNKKEVNHIDGDKTNNFHMNLEWVTGEENRAHQVANRLGVRDGEENGNSKLIESQVLEIRDLFNKYKKLTYVEIGREFKVSSRTISLIVNRKIWKHI